MDDFAYEPVADLVATIGAAIGAGAFTVAGVLIEQAGLQSLGTGQLTVGLWEIWLGSLALFVGLYLLGYRNVWRRFAAAR